MKKTRFSPGLFFLVFILVFYAFFYLGILSWHFILAFFPGIFSIAFIMSKKTLYLRCFWFFVFVLILLFLDEYCFFLYGVFYFHIDIYTTAMYMLLCFTFTVVFYPGLGIAQAFRVPRPRPAGL